MSLQQIEEQIIKLTERHQMLDAEIKRVEESHGNQVMIIDLKKKKLKLKEEIEKLKRML